MQTYIQLKKYISIIHQINDIHWFNENYHTLSVYLKFFFLNILIIYSVCECLALDITTKKLTSS